MTASPLVFSTHTYSGMGTAIAHLGDFEEGVVKSDTFPDGERYLRVLSRTSSRDAILVGGTVTDVDTLEVFDLACGLVHQGARSLTLVIPFFGHATMERAAHEGEVVTAKTRARLLSAIPVPGSGLKVILLDLHSEGVPHYFEGPIRPLHLYAKPLILAAARELGGDDFVLACTDAGRAKWVESLANDLHVPASFVFKRRLDGSTTQVTAVSAQVKDKAVVIYDDMIRTGGSLVSAARAYLDAGARSIAAICTHGVFPGDALARLGKTGLFTRIVCTDSHPRARELASDFLSVRSVAPLFADALRAER